MTFQKKQKLVGVESMSGTLLATAETYVGRMVSREMRGPGDKEGALQRLAARYGLSPNTIEHIRTGKAKDIRGNIFARIRAAYLDMCERQIKNLQHEILIERVSGGDGTLDDLLAEAEVLAAKIQAKKEQVK